MLGAALLVASAISALSAGLPPSATSAASATTVTSSDPVIAVAGDIACDPTNSNFNGGNGSTNSCRQKYTSDLLVNGGFSGVLNLGDNQYYCGGYQAFLGSYDLSWGKVKAITHPSVGNHEYLTSGGTDCNAQNAGADGYFKYFGSAAGQKGSGYYSFDIGTWHLIALNSNCGDAGGCGATSPQGRWLANDLKTHSNFCTLAFWHIPLFSSGGRANGNSRPFWQMLYDNNADLILSAHDHIYERFAPQTPSGTLDTTRGIREFIVGSGGANHTSVVQVAANSEVRNVDTFGVMKVTLHSASYDWQFVPEAGKTFTDSGTTACHGPAPDTSPPTAPSGLAATAQSSGQVNLSWTASTDNVGVTGYKVYRDGTLIGTTAATTYSDTTVSAATTYSYTVGAFDAAGNTSAMSNIATVTTPASSDTQPPTTPAGLTATAVSSQRVDLSWNAATDNTGLAGYTVYRNGTAVATTGGATTAYSDTTVSASTTYSYTVDAFDAAGNHSPQSAPASVTTPAGTGSVTLFSDDFESGGLTNWTSNINALICTSSLSGCPHAGTYGNQFTANGSAGAYLKKTLSATASEVYFRTYVYIRSQGTNNVSMLQLANGSGSLIAHVFMNSSHQIGIRNDTTLTTTQSTTVMSTGTWHSLEFHVKINGTSGTTDVFLDGTAITSLTSTSANLGTNNVAQVWLGENQTSRTYDLVYDDVVVQDGYVGP